MNDQTFDAEAFNEACRTTAANLRALADEFAKRATIFARAMNEAFGTDDEVES